MASPPSPPLALALSADLARTLEESERRFRDAKSKLLELIQSPGPTIASGTFAPSFLPPSATPAPAGAGASPPSTYTAAAAAAPQAEAIDSIASSRGYDHDVSTTCTSAGSTTTRPQRRPQRPPPRERQCAIAPVEPIDSRSSDSRRPTAAAGDSRHGTAAGAGAAPARDFDLNLGPAHAHELARLRQAKAAQLEALYAATQQHFAEVRRAARRRSASGGVAAATARRRGTVSAGDAAAGCSQQSQQLETATTSHAPQASVTAHEPEPATAAVARAHSPRAAEAIVPVVSTPPPLLALVLPPDVAADGSGVCVPPPLPTTGSSDQPLDLAA